MRHVRYVFLVLWAALLVVALPSQAQVYGLPDFTELVAKQAPAVVNISTTQVVRNSRQILQLDEDDPMFEFFKRFMPRMPQQPQIPHESESKSLGSGFIISADGYILTNAHVIDSADQITVRLSDKREFRAKAIGADKRTDVALIKIEAQNLPTVRLGDVEQLKVGEWVVAIGSPFGFESSVTAGIVSAKGRSLPQENYVPFIQTDVAINPGNSGGPLFNLRGEVVGINSQIYSRNGGYMGLSFSIPIDVAMEIQKQLRSNGKVSRGRIGVVIQEVNKDLADSLGLERAGGAIVNSVEKGGPAHKAGIEPGDIIIKFDGKPVASSNDLPRIVANTAPNTQVPLQVWRNGHLRELSVVVGLTPDDKPSKEKPSKPTRNEAAKPNRLGLVLSELSSEQRKELSGLGIKGGLLIDEVRGIAARADLRAGDILLAIIHRSVMTEARSAEQLDSLLAMLEKGSNVTLLVRRGESQRFVTLHNLGNVNSSNNGANNSSGAERE